MTARKCRTAWGITFEAEPGYRVLLGRFMFGHERPRYLSGYSTATFESRQEARIQLAALKTRREWKRLYPSARVDRVLITVEAEHD